MKKSVKLFALALSACMALGGLSGCGSAPAASNAPASPAATAATAASAAATPAPAATTAAAKTDKVVALLPPVSPTYQDKFDQWSADFHKANPNVTLEINKASWEDLTSKLDVQVQAGSPPDISFIGSDGVPKYLDTGLLVDLKKYATPEMLADYDPSTLNYFKSGDGIYGLPAYLDIQSIGGDKAKLEAAGVDWKSVQKNGWTYDQFRKAIKAGATTKDGKKTYGFVFACSGVTGIDYFSIFSKNAGMPAPFTKDLKYAYTSKNTLKLLTDLRQLIDDGSMPTSLNSVDGGKRWNMFLTGQTMITGKGLAIFESMAAKNNAKIDKNDGSAVKDSIKTNYIVLPVPTFFGCPQQAQGTIDGYIALRGKTAPTDDHLKNVASALYYIASGDRAAFTDEELFCNPVAKTAQSVFKAPAGKLQENSDCAALLASQAAPARPDIPADLGAKSDEIMHKVIIPKFQSLLAGECTPQQMYDAINKAAVAAFGKDGVVQD